MNEEREKSAKGQIARLLSVVLAGVVAAVIIVMSMLYTHGPSGTYLARNVILAPDVTTQLSFQETNKATGAAAKFVFDHVEFSYFDPALSQFRKVELSNDQYAKFYDMITKDRSVTSPTDEIVAKFSENNPATMIVSVRAKSSGVQESLTTAFQEINFVNGGDYYRVELHQENTTGDWAYFYHQGIYHELMKIVSS